YKGLSKPTSGEPSTASIMIETTQIVEALRRANVETVQDLSEHLKPISTALASLADGTNRAIAERMAALGRLERMITGTLQSAHHVATDAKVSIADITQEYRKAFTTWTRKQWG